MTDDQPTPPPTPAASTPATADASAPDEGSAAAPPSPPPAAPPSEPAPPAAAGPDAPAAPPPPAPPTAPPVATAGQDAPGGPPPVTATPAKADLGKRAIALIIDAVLATVVGFVPIVGGIAATAYWLVRDGLELEFMDQRSIGKKLMNLRPVTMDGRPLDMTASAKRNWVFALGGVAAFLASTVVGVILAIPIALLGFGLGIVEVVLVFVDPEGRRLGDKTGGTRVIETQD